jgi:tripartite-type tricarboxylate transporter receptor subunit TctC
MRRLIAAIVGVVLCGVGAGGRADAGWPEKPVKVIVPFAPGGTSDQVARIFQRAIQENKLLPQPVTVVNIGGHFSVGSRQAMESPPDGYTFLLIHIALMGGEGSGVMNFGYRNFEAVASTSEFCLTPVVRNDSPYKTLRELLAAAKEKPDTILFGVNIGAINHIAGLQLQATMPGARFRYVQVGGGAENFRAVLGGHTNAGILSGAEYVSFKASGIRALGYTGPQRHSGIPDVPTVKEQGFDMEFCVANWWFAPKGTPREAVDGMATSLEKAMQTDYIKKELDNRLFDPRFLRGDALRQVLDETYRRIEPVAKQAVPEKK